MFCVFELIVGVCLCIKFEGKHVNQNGLKNCEMDYEGQYDIFFHFHLQI